MSFNELAKNARTRPAQTMTCRNSSPSRRCRDRTWGVEIAGGLAYEVIGDAQQPKERQRPRKRPSKRRERTVAR